MTNSVTPVAEPLPVVGSGSGSVTPVSYVETDENRVLSDTKNPRNGAPSGCETVPDPDSRVWETPCTPQPHATPPQGSVQGEGSVLDSRIADKPVAWHINGSDYDTGCEYEYATIERGIAEAATAEGCVVVPLYRHPQTCPHVRGTVTQHCSLNFTLTDEEREAVEQAIDAASGMAQAEPWAVATLRNLLERLA